MPRRNFRRWMFFFYYFRLAVLIVGIITTYHASFILGNDGFKIQALRGLLWTFLGLTSALIGAAFTICNYVTVRAEKKNKETSV